MLNKAKVIDKLYIFIVYKFGTLLPFEKERMI